MARIPLMLTVMAVGVAVDQVTKAWAQHALMGMPPTSYLGGVLTLIYAENSGVALSLGATLSPTVRFMLFTVGAALLLVGLLVYVLLQHNMGRSESLAYALVISGGLGNVIDRLFNNGHVIDFLLMQAGPLSTAIFNVADMLILSGVGFLFVVLWRTRPMPSATAEPEAPDAGTPSL
ncbi:MAG: signal peptidase II [Bacteroidota bacterium]